jgi:hypothetical protein
LGWEVESTTPACECVSKVVPEDEVLLLSVPELQAAKAAAVKSKINRFICECVLNCKIISP